MNHLEAKDWYHVTDNSDDYNSNRYCHTVAAHCTQHAARGYQIYYTESCAD